MNRRSQILRVLQALQRHTHEPYHVHITDQGSTDGTPTALTQYQAENPGLASLYLLAENVGLARGRNAHWIECIGRDAVRLDDKIEVLSPHWSQIMRRQAYNHHALIAFTDPDTEGLWYDARAQRAEIIEYPMWKCGASMFIPAEVSEALGAWDEFSWPVEMIPEGDRGNPIAAYLRYGFEDLAWMDRAEQIGWPFRYTMSAKAVFLARAGAATRERALQFDPLYRERKAQYEGGERDVFIDPTTTDGYALGRTVPASSLVSLGQAMSLAYP